MDETGQYRRRRQQLRASYEGLYDELAAILFRHDPIGINFGDNTDEYEPEVARILPRLREIGSVGELRRIVHEVFVEMFDPDIAGPESRYESIAQDVWQTWQRQTL